MNKLKTEIKQIIKLAAIHIVRLAMHFLYLFFPVKRGRVTFTSYSGRQYSCNPKYISEYLQQYYPKEFEIVWLFNEPDAFAPLRKQGIRTEKNNIFNRLYYCMTSQINISNLSFPAWAPLRKEQLNICTWHGGGCYKNILFEDKKRTWAEKQKFILENQDTSCMLSTSQYFSEHVIPESFGYSGKILNTGFPRNDIFFQNERSKIRGKINSCLHIDATHDLLLYAPTWRRYEINGENVMPDFQAIKQAYTDRFGRECEILFRAHNHVTKHTAHAEKYIDATMYPDMQELLMACDLLISDYSSCIWDYSLTGRPCLLFTPDLKTYTEDLGFKKDIRQWGFSVCENNEQLCNAIRNLDLEKTRTAMKKHQKDLGSYEQGNAAMKIGTSIYTFYTEKQGVHYET